MDQQLLERYLAAADLPSQAIAGLTPAERNAFPVPGTWSIQQIVLHLMDSDLIAAEPHEARDRRGPPHPDWLQRDAVREEPSLR